MIDAAIWSESGWMHAWVPMVGSTGGSVDQSVHRWVVLVGSVIYRVLTIGLWVDQGRPIDGTHGLTCISAVTAGSISG